MTEIIEKSSSSNLKILLIQQEFPKWKLAYHWSYCAHLGMEEGLLANGVRLFTIAAPFLKIAEKLCAGKKFDQVWINDIVHLDIKESWMKWVSTLAPIRFGLIIESLKYTPAEYSAFPDLKEREKGIDIRLKYFTHVTTLDEGDLEAVNKRGRLLAIWMPAAIPKSCILSSSTYKPNKPAAFWGTIYSERKKWFEYPQFKKLLVKPPHTDNLTLYPFLFDFLQLASRRCIKNEFTLSLYLNFLRKIRRRSFIRYLRSLQNYCAVVNLPSLFKGYVGRVAEGMAGGCPVISWRIPNRPRNEGLFIDGKEILLFDKDNPGELVRQIIRIQIEPYLAESIIENAKNKLLKFHTAENRVRQILKWIEKGEEPVYG